MKFLQRLFLFISGLTLTVAPARASTLYFIEQSGNYNWFSTANWFYYTGTGYTAANTLPAPGDTAVIMTDANAAANNINLGGLTLNGGVTVSGGNFTITAGLSMYDISTFTGSSISILAQMNTYGHCALTGVSLTIYAGAFLQMNKSATINGQGVYLSGTTLFNVGEIILTDGTSFNASFNGSTGCILHNSPNATLSGSGETTVTAANGSLTFDYSGTILCNYGALQLPYSLTWTNTQTNAVVFQTLATNATIVLNDEFTIVPAGMTFVFVGPGVNQITYGSPFLGTLQVGAQDPVSHGINVGTLNLNGGLSGTNGVVHVIAAPGFPSTLNWSGGTISQTTVNIDAGGQFNLTAGDQLTGATVNNSGAATWTGSGSLGFDGTVFNNLPGAVFTAMATNPVASLPISITGSASFFNNQGTFRKQITTNDIDFSEDNAPAPGPFMVNTGLIDVESGRILLYGSTNSSQINVAAGAQLRFYQNTNTLTAGTAFTGAGTIAFGGGTVILNTNVTFASLIIDAGNAVVTGSGNLVVSGLLNWSAGTLQGAGALNVNPGASLSINGGTTLHRALNNSGASTLIQGTPLNVGNGANINNLISGIFLLQSASSIGYDNSGAVPVFLNAGLLESTTNSPQQFASIGLPVTNSGSVLIQGYGLSFGASPSPATQYTQTAGSTVIAAGATMQADRALNYVQTVFLQGGTLSGSGTLDGFVTNSGATVRPGASPGILTVNQGYPTPYSQGPGGTMNIELGGLTAGTQFDQLNNGGNNILGGTLNVSLINGFQPAVGESFPIVTWISGTDTGKFATLNVPAGISVNYSNAGLYLVVTNVVPVQVLPPQLTAGGLSYGFGTVTNQNYTVQSSTNLWGHNWILYSNFTGNGSLMNFILPVTNASQQFFRVLQP